MSKRTNDDRFSTSRQLAASSMRVFAAQAQRAEADALLLDLARRGQLTCVCGDVSRYEANRCVCGCERGAELLRSST